MEFEINKDEFLKGLQAVQNAISQKNTLPILANLLLETEHDNVKLTATDLDIGISSYVASNMKEAGAITIPAKKLIDIIKEMPQENAVSIVLKKNNMITIDCGKAHFKIIGLPKDEFPQIPEFKNKDNLTIQQKTLKEMLTVTSFAVSKDETRYVLNGVLMEIEKEKITIAATDGRRLAVSVKQLPEKTNIVKKVIIPAKTIQELQKTLNDDGDVKIYFGDSQILFDLDKTKIISRLIEGEYPNYEQVIPKEKKEKIKIKREDLLASARRASLFVNPDSLAVKVDITKNKMIVSKSAAYIGEVRDEIGVEYAGRNISIGFNPNYIIDVLKSLDDESIYFELEDTDKPGVIRKGNEFIYVVLPMQVT
ncbi:MAG: DNA polymerase III subunit beta [Candidatus Omnitrophota bacterium]